MKDLKDIPTVELIEKLDFSSLKDIRPTRPEIVEIKGNLLEFWLNGAITGHEYNKLMLFTNKLSLGDLLSLRTIRGILFAYWRKTL